MTNEGTMKALLLENIHPEGVRLLTERGIEVETLKGALDEAELIDALRGVKLLGIRSKTNVTRNVLEASPELQAIGAFCIGTNQVDLTAAARLGIPVFNAPFSNTRSVVELVIAEIIALARHLTDKNARMHAGIWDKSATGRARSTRADPRHRRLRQHRQPAVSGGGVDRHAGLLL